MSIFKDDIRPPTLYFWYFFWLEWSFMGQISLCLVSIVFLFLMKWFFCSTLAYSLILTCRRSSLCSGGGRCRSRSSWAARASPASPPSCWTRGSPPGPRAGVRGQVTGIRWQKLSVRNQVSGVKCQEPGVRS